MLVHFYWTLSECNNTLPDPIIIPCDIKCEPGTRLSVNLNSTKVECLQCPSDTYSTGNVLRLSDIDQNWNKLPKNAHMNLYYKGGKNLLSILFA